MKDKYFLYDPENGFEKFETKQECKDAAEQAIQCYLDEAWDENVENMVTGVITHSAKQTNVVHKPEDPEEAEEVGWNDYHDYTCDYDMLPINTLWCRRGKFKMLTEELKTLLRTRPLTTLVILSGFFVLVAIQLAHQASQQKENGTKGQVTRENVGGSLHENLEIF